MGDDRSSSDEAEPFASFAIPGLAVSVDEAMQLVRDSPLAGLTPATPGVAAATWQELATVATAPQNIRWLGKQPLDLHDEVDFDEVHARGEQTNLIATETWDPWGHRNRYGEKALKHGGIDICVRVLKDFEAFPLDRRVGYGGPLDAFHLPYDSAVFLLQLDKIEYLLKNYESLVLPRLVAVHDRKERKKEKEREHERDPEVFAEHVAAMQALEALWTPTLPPPYEPKPYDGPSAQQIANDILTSVISWCHRGTKADLLAVKECRTRLGSQLTGNNTDEAFHKDARGAYGYSRRCEGTGWDALLDKQPEVSLRLVHAILRAKAPTFRPYAQGTQYHAQSFYQRFHEYSLYHEEEASRQYESFCTWSKRRRAFDDEAHEYFHDDPPPTPTSEYEARRNRDACRVVAGVRPSVPATQFVASPIALVAAWLAAKAEGA